MAGSQCRTTELDRDGYSKSPLSGSLYRTGSPIKDRDKDSSILRIWRRVDSEDLENGKGVKSEDVKGTKKPPTNSCKNMTCQDTENSKKQTKSNHKFRLLLLAMCICQTVFTATSMYFNVPDRKGSSQVMEEKMIRNEELRNRELQRLNFVLHLFCALFKNT
jgi:hypothetical protein